MGELKVLAKGVDTLHVSGKGAVRADVWDQVDALRKLGELNESAEMVEFPETEPAQVRPIERALAADRALTHLAIVHSETTGPNPHWPLTWMVVGVSLMTSGLTVGMMWPRSIRFT